MKLNQLDVITQTVRADAEALGRLLNITPDVVEDAFAQLTIGGFVLMLSPAALVPLGDANGIIVHFEVDDPDAYVARAAAVGWPVLHGPTTTDWGTRSVLVAGPGSAVLDFYRQDISVGGGGLKPNH